MISVRKKLKNGFQALATHSTITAQKAFNYLHMSRKGRKPTRSVSPVEKPIFVSQKVAPRGKFAWTTTRLRIDYDQPGVREKKNALSIWLVV